MHPTFVRALPLAFVAVTAARGQLVTPKTVPIHQDDQFAIFPSSRVGMGDVSIALDDTLADPFANPAKATRVRSGVLFTAPYAHGISAGNGGGETLPVGGIGSAGDWSAAAVFALQTLNHGTGPTLNDRSASNQYGSVAVARRLANGWSIGGSVYAAGINAMDGVRLLFAQSDQIQQSGSLFDARVGATKEWDGRRFEILLLTDRTHLTQDTHYTTYFYPPSGGAPGVIERAEHNLDQTNIWGIHTAYAMPLGDEGWHVGWLATANRLSHPKIPNYDLQQIPRDPGTTYGYNIGMGVGRAMHGTTFGADVIEEPIVSHTWGTAGHDTSGAAGTVRSGETTVDNHFRFSNAKIRIGLGHDFVPTPDSSRVIGLQLGLIAYAINYRLRQSNFVSGVNRVDDENWTEWTPTVGVSWRTRDFTLQYTYRRTCGPSDCWDMSRSARVTVPVPGANGGGVIAAPSTPLTVDGGVAHAHRITMTIPIH